jgi:Putative DNA-binding domain
LPLTLKELFDSLSGEHLQTWIARGQEEHLRLDFKTASSPDLSSTDDKKNLAKVLAGFANSDGGIAVWGVDARKNSDGVDCAIALKLIPNAALFVSRLNELTASSVSPVVDGVEHRTIPINGVAGCAVSLIPPSDSGPHMAKAAEDRYYKRSGTNFIRMEHFDLADMFGRRRRPKLGFRTHILSGGSEGGGGTTAYKGKLVFGLTNGGRGSANAVYLALRVSPPYQVDPFGLEGNRGEGLARIAHPGLGWNVKYFASRDIAIHPSVTLDVGAIELTATLHGDRQLVLPKPLSITYEFAAEDSPLESGELTMTSHEIAMDVYPAALYRDVQRLTQ